MQVDKPVASNEPVQPQQVLKEQKGKGKVEATDEWKDAHEGTMGASNIKEQKMSTVEQKTMEMQEKSVIHGMYFDPEDLELIDINCTLKMNEKLSPQQKFLLGNMFVEFADILTVDDVTKKELPRWPMEKPWFAQNHVPLVEKRTYRFRALLPILFKYILQFPEFKDYHEEIGVIDYASISSDHILTFAFDRKFIL